MKYPSLLFLVGCAPALAQPAPCVVPVTRDRAGILGAVAVAGPSGRVCLDAGDYIVTTPTSPPGARRPYAVLPVGTTEIYGMGADVTVVHFTGDAGLIDWHGITLTGGSAHDFTVETSSLTGTVEQTHAMRVFGPANDGHVYNMVFDHPVRHAADGTEWPGGDSFQFVCYVASPCLRWRIDHSLFRHSDRSGVAAHGGTEVEISDNEFRDTGDQDVDGEGDSGGNHHWRILRNAFMTGPHAQGDIAIQLQRADDILIEDNKFWGRGVFSYEASNVEIDRNTIVLDRAGGGSAVIEIKKCRTTPAGCASTINIHDNALIRTAAAGPGFVVRATPQGTGTPDHLTVAHNTIAQGAQGDVVNTVGMVGLTVENNTVFYSGPSNKGYGVLALGSAGAAPTRTDQIVVSGNIWVGPLAGVIGIAGSYGGTGWVTAISNVAMGPLAGLVCGNANVGSRILGPLTLSWLGLLGNAWPSSPSGCAGVPVL